VWTILTAIFFIVDYCFDPENFVLQLNWGNFVVLILLSLCLIPLQTTVEELVFRGYLPQAIAARTKSRWLAILIPALLFGLLHYGNPEVEEFGFWIMMPNYVFIALMLGLISILDDGIELAIGIHAANNIFLAIFITHPSGAFQTDALFEVQRVNPVAGLIVTVAMCLIALAYFAHRYKWNFAILNKKLVKEQIREY
jgi:membrane protease YdiL (CAAX protease family)